MTATTSPQHPAEGQEVSAPAPEEVAAPPEDRGTLNIDDRVVERVAGYAVTQVPHAAAAPRRILGMSMGQARPEEEAHVAATVRGATASIEVALAVAWPHPVDEVANAARSQVRRDVERITGVRVDHVDVEITSLDFPSATRRVR
jgi:uncharacterized alkaline shock family protein YloU